VASPDLEEEEIQENDGFSPRGTLLFVLAMLLGYALYWAYLWFIVVIERGM
jgi:hypothetical protein